MNTLKSLIMSGVLIILPGINALADEPGLPIQDESRASVSATYDSARGSALKNNLVPQSQSTLLNADSESLAKAVGHYERSRSLLIAAIREFDAGYKYAKPDQILDSKIWRSTLLARAQELAHVLAPQPRITKGGAKFGADTRLLNSEAKRAK